MGIINYSDEDVIKQEIRDRYDEYRSENSSPRTNHEKDKMLEFIIQPLLDRLVSWSAYEETAQHKIELLQDILNN